MSDGGSLAVAADLSNSGVTSFAQQSFAPGQAPQLYKDLGPAVAIHPEGYAPGFPCTHILHPHRHPACLFSRALCICTSINAARKTKAKERMQICPTACSSHHVLA